MTLPKYGNIQMCETTSLCAQPDGELVFSCPAVGWWTIIMGGHTAATGLNRVYGWICCSALLINRKADPDGELV